MVITIMPITPWHYNMEGIGKIGYIMRYSTGLQEEEKSSILLVRLISVYVTKKVNV
jgi:hypothetical protein